MLTLADVEASGRDEQTQRAVQDAAAQVAPEDVLTLIYTSGTTGPPKGVQLSHRNLMSTVRAVEAIVHFEPASRVICWLPAAHIAERNAHHYVPIVFGLQITCCPDPREVMSYLPEVRPQWFFAVPRIWEKLKAGLETMLAGLPDEQRERTERALAAAVEKVRLEQRGEPVPAELAAEVAAADEQIFAGLRAMLGFDQVEAVNVGAAPTPRRGARVLPRDRHPARRAVGDVRDLRRRLRQPAREDQARHRRPARARRRDHDRR